MGTNITGIGNANAIGFKSRVTGGAYFPPELKDALVGVWSAYGKSNDSTDRNIIKNKIKDKGGDFELLNFNYKEGSGYGKYETDFLNWNVETSSVTVSSNKLEVIKESTMYKMYRYSNMTNNLPSFKVKISNLQKGYIRYYYREQTGIEAYIDFHQNGIYELPASYKVDEGGTGTNGGFNSNAAVLNVGVTIEQIPEFKGAVVTDGVDDLIISKKSIPEMLEGNTGFTVISMIAQLDSRATYTNYVRNNSSSAGRNVNYGGERIGKTGIYGFTKQNIYEGGAVVINNILGDKSDYTAQGGTANSSSPLKYYVQAWQAANGSIGEARQIAWYWTFIANRVLTEDEINLVIEKYNLDRPGEIVKPQIYYNVKKQKITNENHSAFDDKLIDYSGNGYDAKLYNFAWEGNSGIGNYPVVFGANKTWQSVSQQYVYDITNDTIHVTNVSQAGNGLLYSYVKLNEELTNVKEIPSFIITIKGLEGSSKFGYRYLATENANTETILYLGNGTHELPKSFAPTEAILTQTRNVWVGLIISPISEGVFNFDCNITIEVIPSNENALCLDGVDDYGKVTELPVLKDYTIAVYRKWLQNYQNSGSLISKSNISGSGSFLMEQKNYSNVSATYSYGARTENLENPNLDKDIYTYQSKYVYNGVPITPGTGVDGTDMWLATIRDRDERFSSFALKTLMLFPYSLSEFLLERQIEKIKSGTLYPGKVEFRPVIPEDENITKVNCFVVNSGVWKVIKPGDYVDVGARIVLNVYTKLPYKIAGASSTAFTGMTVGPSTALNVWDVKGYIKDKTPQKIKLTLAINEDIVQWNPTISANIPDSYDTVTEWFINGWETKVAVGDWIKKSDRIFFKLKLKDPLHEIGKVTFGGSECQATKVSNWSESNNLWEIVTYSSVGDLSQVFNVQVYEYIRYEDIVQPYPVLLRFNDENGNEVSWGGKFRVGSTITRIGSAADSNLLPNIYNIFRLLLNDNQVTSSKVIVEKTMVFKAKNAYIFDNNKPKCILSPRLLRIPNSSYKILGHIPDISGHGNHGVIHNSAYEGASGANGYLQNFSEWTKASGVSSTDSVISSSNNLVAANGWIAYVTSGTVIPTFKVEISGIPINGNLRFEGSDQTLVNGVNTIQGLTTTKVSGFYISNGYDNDWSNLRIEQIGEYEGAYCLDGVGDFVTIPTITGGKQVLMKVNWQKEDSMIYNQNPGEDNFAIFANDYNGSNVVKAYASRNNGSTYIDGILNNNILATQLKNITHNITITNENVINNTIVPVIGANAAHNNFYAQMALYDFMLFDEISTDDKIKELNEYVGTEGNVFEFNPPMFTIDLPMAIKNIKVYQGGNEISPGYLYLNKDTEFEVYVSLNDGKYAVDTITVDGVEIAKDRVVGYYNIFKFTLNGSSEQKITIHSYEYIMYEDINQPYPTIFELMNTSNNKIYTYGDRLKVGSEFLFTKYINLLPEMYKPNGSGSYNGNRFVSGDKGIVEKTMTFAWSSLPSYLLEGSAPKCIFSPSKLRIPNSSYKYLGYVPDISGNGNNGVFNNFAFSGMSGANGYTYEYTNTSDFSVSSQYARAINSEKIEFFRYINRVTFYRKNPTYKGKIKIEGLTNAISSGKVQHFQIYTNSKTNTETHVFKTDGTYDIDITGIGDATTVYFYVLPTNTSEPGTLDNLITIEQIGNYEGSICFDGVDDYIKIDTTGGMTMLMKANVMSTTNRILYDQRDKNSEGNLYKEFAVLTSNSDSILAYAGRNKNGKTYIDGVLNTNITCGQLLNITHNITALPESNLVGTEQGVRIGASAAPASYCKAAVFDFMLFDTKCTDDVIKQLNDIIGIEGDYVQKPSYYWDAYGKNNFSDDRTYLENLVNPTVDTERLNVTNTNWDKLSGYGGYSFKSFNDSADAWNIRGDGTGVEIISRDGYSMTIKKLVQNLDWNISNNEYRYPTILNSELPFKCKSNKNVGLIWKLKYKTEGATSDTTVTLLNQQLTPNVPLEVNLPYKTQEELTELGAVSTSVYYLLYFSNTTLAIGEEYTVEMLPLYPNGLVLDGVDDYLENLDIPALSDFTVITKRTNLLEEYGNNVSYLVKGIAPTGSRDWALLMEYWYDKLCVNFIYDNSVGNYITPFDSIGFVTPTSYNGLPMTKGISNDTAGLRIARRGASYWNGVFYKLMLYPRTTNMLTINMIKNMMAEDGIIDVQGKLFTDKYTGDFYNLDFNKDFLIGN